MREKLLSVGTNHTLLGIRNLVLASAGYEVIAARTGAGAINAINSCGLDAVIVGHSLSPSLKLRVVEAAKGRRLVVIVLHANAFEQHVPDADANLCGIDGAATIMEVLTKLLARPGWRQNCSSTTPRATRVAAAQRRVRTSSPRTYFARRVSSK